MSTFSNISKNTVTISNQSSSGILFDDPLYSFDDSSLSFDGTLTTNVSKNSSAVSNLTKS